MKENMTYFVQLLIVLFSLMFAGEMIVFYTLNDFRPELSSFFAAWVVLTWLILYLLLSLFNTMAHNLTFIVVFCNMFLLLPSYMFIMLFTSITGINVSYNGLVDKNYMGLYTVRIYDEDEVKDQTYIYHKDDKRYADEWNKLNNIESDSDEPETDEYIFWQTGYLHGYNPKFVIDSQVLESNEFKFSFGIFVIVEVMHSAFISLLAIIWIPILYFAFTKKKIPLSFNNIGREDDDRIWKRLGAVILLIAFIIICFFNTYMF